MSPYRVWSSVFLVLTVCLWLYFVCHAFIAFGYHLEHERRVVQEARVIMQTVCGLSREDVAGTLVDCEMARTTAMRHAPLMTALEKTAADIGQGVFLMVADGVRGAGHALGLMGFAACLLLYVASLFARAFSAATGPGTDCHRLTSPHLQQKHESSVRIACLDDSHQGQPHLIDYN